MESPRIEFLLKLNFSHQLIPTFTAHSILLFDRIKIPTTQTDPKEKYKKYKAFQPPRLK